jgi:AcrR family transcriptional regulator
MGLFATIPVDEVTVQDIANTVGMTPAAVYYHFASKEQILVEGMQRFREELLDHLRQVASAPAMPIGDLVAELVVWVSRRRVAANVYFVSSIGLNLMIEAVRREGRHQMVEILRPAVPAGRHRTSNAEAGAIAVALVSLIETSLASLVNQDATYRGLGARRFPAEVGQLASRIAGAA